MTRLSTYLTALFLSLISMLAAHAQSKKTVDRFDSVIISPHIQTIFVQGDKESVEIKNAKVSEDKINIEVKGKTLRVYLDGAKVVTKNVKINTDDWKGKKALYQGTMMTAIITYTELKDISIRGEETVVCKSPIESEDFDLSLYGEAIMTMESLHVEEFKVAIYGESSLEIIKGNIENQKYAVYGEGKVNTLGVDNSHTKITAFGEGNFRINVSDALKVTAFGEANVSYTGTPDVDKGIVIGEAVIHQIR